MLGEDWIGLGTATKIQTWIGNGRTEFDAAAGRPLERMIGRRQDPPRSGPNSRPSQPAALGPPCQCQPTALLEPSLSHPPSAVTQVLDHRQRVWDPPSRLLRSLFSVASQGVLRIGRC